MKKITCITPTGGRSKIFEMTRKCIASQTMQPDQWLVVDDGHVPLPDNLQQGMDYIRRTPIAGEGYTLARNMEVAIPHITGDIILAIEDDDWYSPLYIETMHNYLLNYDLVGEGRARYYHVPGQRYARLRNKQHASLAQTGFSRRLLPIFNEVLLRGSYIDIHFWKKLRICGFLFFDVLDKLRLHCSLKGLPGRPGIGAGHNEKFRDYNTDKDYIVLKGWIGEENVVRYVQCCIEERIDNGTNNSK